MSIQQLNPTPRFTLHMMERFKATGRRVGMVDVGARGGMPQFAQPFYGSMEVTCFDPDEAECARLNIELGEHGIRFLPFALHDKAGRFPFHLARSPWCHGFTKANQDFISRFPNWMFVENVGVIELDAVTLDMALDAEKVESVDFIKLDTEGTELCVLQGALETLSKRGVVGVFTEFWWDHRHHNQPSFAELDIFMRAQGFHLFDIAVQRYPRVSMPIGPMSAKEIDGKYYLCPPPLYEDHGQVLTGDALYFRDPVIDEKEGLPFDWTPQRLLNLLCFLDVFQYGDFAIELIDVYRDRMDFGEKPEVLIDLLIPPLNTPLFKYPEYWRRSEAFFRQVSPGKSEVEIARYKDQVIRPVRYDTDA